ncbi:MAG: barstar family protein [Betaproteobacteria bacterium]
MKIPELTDVSAAGVQDWDGASDVLRTAAKAAHLKFFMVDLGKIAGKPALLKALEKGINLPEHFGHNWDALADCLEDDEWMDKNGVVILWQGAETFRKAHHSDFETALDIFSEASEYWQEHHKPFWLFLAS